MGKQEEYHLNSIDSIGRLPLSEQVYVTLKQDHFDGRVETAGEAERGENCGTA